MNYINSYETIESFLLTLRCKEATKKRKYKILIELCGYIERSQIMEDQWDFRHVKKLQYKEKEFYIPLDDTVLLNFMQEKSLSLANSDRTFNDYVTTLDQFCQYLFKRKILVENPAMTIPKRRLKYNDMSDQLISFEESIRLLEAAYLYDKKNQVRNFALVLVLLTTAMRSGELSGLTEDKIHFALDLLFANGKSGRRRRILTQGVEETIKALLKDPERLKAVAKMEKKYLFYSDKGNVLTPDEMNKLLKEFAKKAGINKSITTYWLRRTFATMLSNAEFCLVEIKRIFDHDRITSTEHYVFDTSKKEIKELINNSTLSNMLTEFMRERLELV